MAAGLFFVIALVVGLLVVGFLVLLGVLGAGSAGALRTEEKAELRELRGLVTRLDRLAYEHREVEPGLAFAVIDEINNVKRKELE